MKDQDREMFRRLGQDPVVRAYLDEQYDLATRRVIASAGSSEEHEAVLVLRTIARFRDQFFAPDNGGRR